MFQRICLFPTKRTQHLYTNGSHQIKRLLSSTTFKNSNWLVTSKPDDHYDIIIVGGGVVGSALANALSSIPSTSKLSIGVINPDIPMPLSQYDRKKKNTEIGENNQKKSNCLLPNARSYALSPASLEVLGAESIQKLQEIHRVAHYNRMQVRHVNFSISYFQ